MLNEFIKEIIWEIPKLNERKVYRVFCWIKARQKKYWTFWLWKRDGYRYWISCRQMTYFINLMIDYWFLEIKGHARSKTGHKCRIYKASKQLKTYLNQIKDYVFKKIDNLTQKIKWFCEYNNTITYIKSLSGVKRKFKRYDFEYIWEYYLVFWDNEIWRKNKILRKSDWKIMNLFDFIKETSGKTVYETALFLNIN
jgi:hypothetical protein